MCWRIECWAVYCLSKMANFFLNWKYKVDSAQFEMQKIAKFILNKSSLTNDWHVRQIENGFETRSAFESQLCVCVCVFTEFRQLEISWCWWMDWMNKCKINHFIRLPPLASFESERIQKKKTLSGSCQNLIWIFYFNQSTMMSNPRYADFRIIQQQNYKT